MDNDVSLSPCEEVIRLTVKDPVSANVCSLLERLEGFECASESIFNAELNLPVSKENNRLARIVLSQNY